MSDDVPKDIQEESEPEPEWQARYDALRAEAEGLRGLEKVEKIKEAMRARGYRFPKEQVEQEVGAGRSVADNVEPDAEQDDLFSYEASATEEWETDYEGQSANGSGPRNRFFSNLRSRLPDDTWAGWAVLFYAAVAGLLFYSCRPKPEPKIFNYPRNPDFERSFVGAWHVMAGSGSGDVAFWLSRKQRPDGSYVVELPGVDDSEWSWRVINSEEIVVFTKGVSAEFRVNSMATSDGDLEVLAPVGPVVQTLSSSLFRIVASPVDDTYYDDDDTRY